MSYGAITLDDVLSDLSFLEGNQSVPTSGIDDWKRFAQRTLEEAWRQYPWDFAKTLATVGMVNGIGTLASGAMIDGIYDVRAINSGVGDDNVYTEIPYEEQDDYELGTYKYWLTGSPMNPVINTKEPDTTLTVWYKNLPPQINSSITAPFPDSMIIALGARRYVRGSENPQADTSQEEQIFQRRLEELWGWYNRQKPRKKRRFFSSIATGQVGGD